MTGRRISDEERRQFERHLAEKRPLRAVMAAPPARRRSSVPGPGGVDGGTAERLRRGLLEPQARLDLHGLSEAAAHRALHAFIPAAHARGLRLVLVVTGKGNPRRDDGPAWAASPHGVLKQMAPRWLAGPPLAGLIAHVQGAHVRHGGDGALYVYLRKRR